MSQFIKYYFTSSMLNMFRTLIIHHQEPTTFILYHHIGCVFFFRCVQPATRIPPQPATSKLQHTSKQENTTNVVIQWKSRRLLMMDVLKSETR